MSEIRQKLLAGLAVGDSFTVSRTFDEEDIRRFTALSGDRNPVHSLVPFCRRKKLDGPICHGLLVASMLTEIGGELAWLASSMQLSFRKPVYPGDTITCRFSISEIDADNRARAAVRFTNQRGVVVLEAELAGILPSTTEKELLHTSR